MPTMEKKTNKTINDLIIKESVRKEILLLNIDNIEVFLIGRRQMVKS